MFHACCQMSADSVVLILQNRSSHGQNFKKVVDPERLQLSRLWSDSLAIV